MSRLLLDWRNHSSVLVVIRFPLAGCPLALSPLWPILEKPTGLSRGANKSPGWVKKAGQGEREPCPVYPREPPCQQAAHGSTWGHNLTWGGPP
jgi:hypothetical protein